jgi:anti-sigma factor RsiW
LLVEHNRILANAAISLEVLTMSDHAWVRENVASYLAGALDPAESERLEQHTAQCDTCRQILGQARALDDGLETLFRPVRPGLDLEDRLIQSLRQKRTPRHTGIPLLVRFALGAAALLLFGGLGASLNHLILPGAGRRSNAPELAFGGDLALNRQQSMQRGSSGSDRTAASPQQAADESQVESLKDVGALAEEMRQKQLSQLGNSQDWGERGEKKGQQSMADASFGFSVTTEAKGSGRASTVELADGIANGVTINKSQVDGPVALSHDGESLAFKAPVATLGVTAVPGTDGTAMAANTDQNFYSYLDAFSAATAYAPAAEAGKGAAGWAWAREPAAYSLYYKPGAQTQAIYKEAKERLDKLAAKVEAKPAEVQDLSLPVKDGKDAGAAKPTTPPAGAPSTPPAAGPRKIIIRSGELEFEIESFDGSVAAVTKLVTAIPGGFIATVNSEKLPNGKVQGSIVVRLPPEHLDTLVLDLRRELAKGGELKGQRIGSQDITKQYTDLESRLRAARAMEERLLLIIKTGKGEIKDLLAAEKELGEWRTKIEEFEGELRYYANQVALSTLTIKLHEKEIRAPFAILETERVQMGVEVEDVDKALQQGLAAVTESKGRVIKSELKQLEAGQYQALLHFEVAPDSAGPLRDRFRQFGNVARLEIDRVQQAEGGSGLPRDVKTKRNDTLFVVSLYNVANVAPRETIHMNLACLDTEEVYRKIVASARGKNGRVITSSLNRQRNEQTTGTVQFEVKTAEADALLLTIKGLGEVMRLQVTENPDAQNVTSSKRGFNVQLFNLSQVQPRETMTVQLASRDVPAGYRALQDAISKAKGRILTAQLNEQDKQNITGTLDFEVRRVDEAALLEALTAAGDIFSRKIIRAQDSDNVIDSKIRLQVTLINAARLQPRETVILGIEVTNVDQTAAVLTSLANESRGRTVEAHTARERSGRVTAKLLYEVPLAGARELVEKFKEAGVVRVQQSTRNNQVPESTLAAARIDVTLSNVELIVPSDEGLWPPIRTGLHSSFVAISWSLSFVVIGLCAVLPWVLIIYGGYRLFLWLRKRGPAPTPAA